MVGREGDCEGQAVSREAILGGSAGDLEGLGAGTSKVTSWGEMEPELPASPELEDACIITCHLI